jgi:hypothetical protein
MCFQSTVFQVYDISKLKSGASTKEENVSKMVVLDVMMSKFGQRQIERVVAGKSPKARSIVLQGGDGGCSLIHILLFYLML